MHIAITGNIGAGKTTLTKLIAERYDWSALFEDVERNPYLDDFYRDMKKWAFNLQIYFLGSRFNQVKKIRESGKDTVQDRTIYEDAYIFASNLNDMGLLSTRDYNNYLYLFNLMTDFIESPDLIIYLKASITTLISQIKKRGRDYENSISIEYLKRLNEKYNKWIDSHKQSNILIIDVDNLDFVENKDDLESIYSKIENKINRKL